MEMKEGARERSPTRNEQDSTVQNAERGETDSEDYVVICHKRKSHCAFKSC